MLDYEWGNQSAAAAAAAAMFSDEQTDNDSDHNRQFFDPYATTTAPTPFHDTATAYYADTHHHFGHHPQPPHGGAGHHQIAALYDPRAAVYGGGPAFGHPTLSLESSFLMVPKSEPVGGGVDFSGAAVSSRIGLNLGGRTYFSSAEDEFVNRLYRRSRPVEPGSVNSPRCQAEGCNADLTHAKHYHRRHKVCEFHSKAATVIAAGLTQRFCQQCSRFHLLTEFDNGKRSCRKRLADHNRRRRKNPQPNQEPNKANSSSSNSIVARSPPDSGAQSSLSVTVAISPPRMSLDYFR